MIINDNTKNNLTIDYLYSKIKVYSPYGIELKKVLAPYTVEQVDQLALEYDRIEILIDEIKKDRYSFVELRNNFKKVKGLKTTFKKIRNDEVLTVTEFFEIKNFLFILKDIHKILDNIGLEIGKNYEVNRIEALEELLDPEGYNVNSFYIYDDYSKKLKTIRKKLSDLSQKKKKLKKALIEKYSNKFDLNIRRSGEITIDKNNKQLIQQLKATDDFYYKSETFMNVSFEISNTEAMDTLDDTIEELKIKEEQEVNKIRKQLTQATADYSDVLEQNYHNIGHLDLLIGKAFFSHGVEGVKPQLLDEHSIIIDEGRHLMVEEELRKNNKKYIPVSVHLSTGVSLLTGANMGGKTVSLKMVGLLTYMAQLGLFIPAKRYQFKPVNYIFASLGDDQDINRGLSSFGAEIENVKQAIDHCETYGLILIDELARGTNPKEGYALSKALIKYFNSKKSIIFISTHFDGLVFEGIHHLQVKGLKEISEDVSFENIQEHMDYRLIEVKNKTQVPKDALNISRILGLTSEIIDAAEKILEEGSERSGE